MYFLLVTLNSAYNFWRRNGLTLSGGTMPRKSGLATLMFFLTWSVFAQQQISRPLAGANGAQVPAERPPVAGRRAAKAPRQEPCWQEAGVSKGAMQQRKSIEHSARAEIQSLCGNHSITPQQRREQIRAIRERTRQQVDALVSPQQREALKSCQQARGHGNGGGFHGGGGRGEGPCGELNEPREQNPEPEP